MKLPSRDLQEEEDWARQLVTELEKDLTLKDQKIAELEASKANLESELAALADRVTVLESL